jgi:hypothetical protein
MCGGTGGGGGGGEGDTAGQGGTGGSGGNVGGGSGGIGGGWAPDPVSSGDPASGGLGGIGQGVSDGGSPSAALAAAEAAMIAGSKPPGELTDADISAMITALSDQNIAKTVSSENLAKAFMESLNTKNVDKSKMASGYLSALVAKGELPESDVSQTKTMAKAASFVTDFMLSNILPPMAVSLASKIGINPAMSSLTGLLSSESMIADDAMISMAKAQASKALGLPDPADVTIGQAPGEESRQIMSKDKAKKSGSPTPAAAPIETLSTSVPAPPADLAEMPVLGLIGTGLMGANKTGPQGLESAPSPTIKKKKLG